MDLISQLTPEMKNILHLDRNNEQKVPELSNEDQLSTEWVKQLPANKIPYIYVYNLYDINKWQRLDGRKFQFKGHRLSPAPPEKDLTNMDENIAYITKGYVNCGANACVETLVGYNQHLTVIKRSEDIHHILYEIVIQAYLFEQLKHQKICVPEIYFVQSTANLKTDVCMCRAKGIELDKLNDTPLKIALAHVCKALYHLQENFNFMHRDLSAINVFFDEVEYTCTFIDFGYSCIKPNAQHKAWQSGDESFFDNRGDHASGCSNRSLDMCILISYLSRMIQRPWCIHEHQQMKTKLKLKIDNDDQRLPNTKYTNFENKDWQPGNLLKFGDGPHWWLYNMVEFPMEDWYPENVLKRLLIHMPIKDWFHIRENWHDTFDSIMPKDIRIKIKPEGKIQSADLLHLLHDISMEECKNSMSDIQSLNNFTNKQGLLQNLVAPNKVKIQFDGEQEATEVFAYLCEQIGGTE